ncbi:CinA family nicotinamide mononucleotide deamidase-related protein [Acanthopleuribacter pedis]|uniref:CinA-like protein n=2 Tax=Acanthopleuribacter pedis TaxID=442870 RepID=A0A8J7QLF1_9BACT|nr:CinA family nicotinamide mononucleotide deamidase-related protein [Acanthopleuribacter pedis]
MTTGEEVLSGQIADGNATWLSRFLTDQGLEVSRRYTIGDRLPELVEQLCTRARSADVIIVNGGLGPTDDDFSAQAAAHALNEDLVLFPEWVQQLNSKFAQQGRTVSERQLKQARLPKSAQILDNPRGTACGFVVQIHRAWVYFTPGPPFELHKMMREQIMPHLAEHLGGPRAAFVKKITTFGIGEARINDLTAALRVPTGVRVGYRATFPYTEVKLMGAGEEAEQQAEAFLPELRAAFGDNVVFEGNASLELRLQDEMIKHGFTLATAESCTGGMIASRIVDNSGSSAWFHRGYVTYTNAAKHDMLGVPNALFDSVGAVSTEVAAAMAAGAVKHGKVSHALAVSGIAGPGGGTETKPVGTVAFGLASPEQLVSMLLQLPNWGREKIRILSATIALDMLRRSLEGVSLEPTSKFLKVVSFQTDKL